MVTVKLRFNRNRRLKNGAYPLVIQVIWLRKKKQISTGYFLHEREFDFNKERLVYVMGLNTNSRVKKVNAHLLKLKSEVYDLLEFVRKNNPDYTIEDFARVYDNFQSKSDFMIYMETLIDEKEKMKKTGTANAYKSTLNSLKRFIPEKRLDFSRIDSSLIEKYINFLATTGVQPNTVAFYLRNFRAVYNRGKKDRNDHDDKNPFCRVRTRIEKTNKRALSKEDIRRIEHLELESGSLKERTRNLFMFSFNTMGMSFVDILKLKKCDWQKEKNLIVYYRTKTRQIVRVPVNEQAKAILQRYGNETSEYLFAFMDAGSEEVFYKKYRSELERTNYLLKKIGKELNLEIPLTMYVARHSWASAANDTGAAITSISTSLGHTSLKTTQIYLKELDIETIRQLNNCVTGG